MLEYILILCDVYTKFAESQHVVSPKPPNGIRLNLVLVVLTKSCLINLLLRFIPFL
jgi:hypothetical protein